MELRDYQIEIADKASKICNDLGIVMLAMEVRTGKTITAFAICDRIGARRVLFVTKKKPIDSGTIEHDYQLGKHNFSLTLKNFESIHKLTYDGYDCIIVDEFHSLGAFPKPSLRAKKLRELFKKCKPKYHIMLSGTPSPESFSQFYHPFWVNPFKTPFAEENFYQWARTYVDVTQKIVAHGQRVNDYSNGKQEMIMSVVDMYMITYTQKQAGFNTAAKDVIHNCPMSKRTYQFIEEIKAKRYLVGSSGKEILADTPVKLMQKCHQIYSGTVKTECGSGLILDTSKADYIWGYFGGHKLAIFYKYKAELEMLMSCIPDLTTDIAEFDSDPQKNIALQIISGREGISLKKADYLIMFNIDFSNVSYIQSRNRLATKDRETNEVHWIFSEGGMEHDIYKVVKEKEEKYNYTHFNELMRSNA